MIKLLKVRKYKVGYYAKVEEFSGDDATWENGKTTVITSAYTPDGLYIGTTRLANMLYKHYGIEPELRQPNHSVCTIGFSERNRQWYGWSHKAFCGFQIGDEVVSGDITNQTGWTEKYLKKHPEADKSLPMGFKAKTLEDCKLMAIAFADTVS